MRTAMCDSTCSEWEVWPKLVLGKTVEMGSLGTQILLNMPTSETPGRQSIQTLFMLLLAFLSQALGLDPRAVGNKLGSL